MKKVALCLLLVLFSSCTTTSMRKTVKWGLVVSGVGALGGSVVLSSADVTSMSNDTLSGTLMITGGGLLMFGIIAFLLDID